METGGSCGSMNRGPRATGGPEWGHREFRQKCVKWHTCTVHIGFSTAGEVILRTQKASKLLAAGGPHWGSLHRSPGPVAGSPQSPTPLSALRASSFSPWGRSNWAPKLLLNQGPQSLATPLPLELSGKFFPTAENFN